MARPKKSSAIGAGMNRGGFRFRADGSPVVNTRFTRGMTRGQFLRRAGVAGVGVAAAGLGLGGVARAHGETPTEHATHIKRPDGTPAYPGDAVMWVYPYQYPDDVEHIQWALDNVAPGGTVLLKTGTFVFGPEDSVGITKDIEIIGEGPASTIITGGHDAISCNAPVNLIVRDLRIEDVTFSGIYIGKSTGLEVTGCEIVNVKGMYIEGVSGTPGEEYASAIFISTYLKTRNPYDISGPVLISNNYLCPNEDISNPVYSSEESLGIYVLLTACNPQIIKNEICNTNYVGISVNSNLGSSLIQENTVNPGQEQSGVEWSIGNGLSVDNTAGFPLLPFTSVTVEWNIVTCENPQADGIVVSGPTPAGTISVNDNTVNMLDSEFGALTIYYDVYNSVWENNTVTGNMVWSIGIVPIGSNRSQNNVFRNNNLNESCPTIAHIFFDNGSSYNKSENNDFRGSYDCVPGWGVGGPGCVLLDMSTSKNLIRETLFPEGTGICQQVMGLQGNLVVDENEVVGWNPGMCVNYKIPQHVYDNMGTMIDNRRAAAAKKYPALQ